MAVTLFGIVIEPGASLCLPALSVIFKGLWLGSTRVIIVPELESASRANLV
jgi:hypothetical protein